ncbi:glycosyltransferase family 4 protein [Clostridium uliginosum]|uniref:Glycosyltransferase involved in cell wall bisynthesis n=1 Tax=Clostridium uliginosum TaxID=119641 RepID=A0A1I1ML98_9CLOT|nr:glycosyltransferase family 4 protein [Clostridium uliginosum]SFC86179.1 Glycosyltransferase involved in cell wall bisynthesis [Clostridium uliginosum]
MKICYLADINSAHTHKWLNYFVEKGYDIHVISLGKGEYEGVTVHCLDVEDGVMKKASDKTKLEYLKKIKSVKELVKEIKPDILHAHYASSYGLLGALTNYHPYMISVWGSDVYDFPIKSPIHKFIIKYNLKKADYILSTSNVMKKETEKYTNKSIEVTPFGVDINKFTPKKVEKDEIVIGTIKTLEEKYGVQYLVKAFKEVKDRNKDLKLKLRIGGKGSQEQYLKSLSKELGIKDDVAFLGFVTPENVIKEFQSFDMAVFPSTLDSESFGVAAVEAEACGTPIIVSNVGGLMESTKPGVTSLVVNKGSVDELADKIDELVNNKELREEMGRAARKFVVDNYSLEDNFSYVDSIYKKVNLEK